MAFQTISEIKERIEKPINRSQLAKAANHQNDVSLFTKAIQSAGENPAASSHFTWVKGLLKADDKFEIYRHLTTFPLTAVEVCDEIFVKLAKIYQGKNPSYKVDFVKDDLQLDWEEYRTEVFDIPSFFRNEAWQVYRECHNSVLVVDLPAADQMKSREGKSEPYLYFVDISQVYDVGKDADKFEEIIFRNDEKIFVYDDQYYRVFKAENSSGFELGEQLVEEQHGLGVCPARWFVSTPLNKSTPAVKANAISSFIGSFGWYQFFSTSKKHLDLYAPYPVMSGFAGSCNYTERSRDGMEEYYCGSGFLKSGSDYVRTAGDRLRECPVCSKKKMHGPGSFVEIDPPGMNNDKADLRNPVGMLNVDTGSLDYNVGEDERLRRKLIKGVTGYSGEPLNNQAVNEKQVGSFHESQTDCLNKVKEPIEEAHNWAETVAGRLRYGKDFRAVSISYGTSYYLETARERLEMYEQAKAKQVDDQILDELYESYLQTKWANNEERLAREKLLMHLDPLRHVGKKDAKDLYREGFIDFKTYFLKINFSSLIAKFERNNGPITLFGSSLELGKKVEMIKETIFGGIGKPAPITSKIVENVE